MQKVTLSLPEIKLVGISVRTNNASERDPATAKIGATLQQYFHQALSEKIPNRKKPGTTYCVYTEYEGDATADYTYFIGEAVDSFKTLPKDLVGLTVPAQTYVKFTHGPGVMPQVCINMWQQIWKMSPAALGGERAYRADFEVYDERANDHENVVLDIYVGI